MIRIPSTENWTQIGDSDTLGTLYSSYNIDLLSNIGKLRISPRMILNMNNSDDADLGVPCAIKFFQANRGSIVVIAGSKVFLSASTNGGPSSAFTEEDAGVTPPTDCNSDVSDAEDFNSCLYVSRASTSVSKITAGGVWSSISNAFASSSGLHDLEYFRAMNRLYGVDDNACGISSLNTSDTPVLSTSGSQYSLNDLVDGVTSRISWIKSNSDSLWIGTIRDTGGAFIYKWDGSQSSGPNAAYQIEDAGTLGCVIVNNTPIVLTTSGKLLAFNGGKFGSLNGVDRYLAKFPVSENYFGTFFSTATNMAMHYNGITLINGEISMLINSTPWAYGPSANPIERFDSGIWNYSFKNGLYLKNTLGTTKSGSSITDFGQKVLNKVGALSFIQSSDNNFNAQINGSYMAGATYYTNATSTATGLWYDDFNDTLAKCASFTTQKIYSSNITEKWSKIYTILGRRLPNSTDKIVLKAKNREDTPVVATITYNSSTTQFTVPTASFTTSPAVGDEVEILQGAIGAGICAHITAISTSGSNYVVTIDETVTGATTQTAKARFSAWKKIWSFSSQNDDFYKSDFPNEVLGASTWIQIKCWIYSAGGKAELSHLIISNKVQEAIE